VSRQAVAVRNVVKTIVLFVPPLALFVILNPNLQGVGDILARKGRRFLPCLGRLALRRCVASIRHWHHQQMSASESSGRSWQSHTLLRHT